MAKINRFGVAVVRRPKIPCAHERVLQDRQLIGIFGDVVQQTIHQTRRDLPTTDRGGPGDCLAADRESFEEPNTSLR